MFREEILQHIHPRFPTVQVAALPQRSGGVLRGIVHLRVRFVHHMSPYVGSLHSVNL